MGKLVFEKVYPERKLNTCVKNPVVECPLELEDYQQGTTAMVRALDAIAKYLGDNNGYLSGEDCNKCDGLNMAGAIGVIKALRESGIEIVMVKTQNKN